MYIGRGRFGVAPYDRRYIVVPNYQYRCILRGHYLDDELRQTARPRYRISGTVRPHVLPLGLGLLSAVLLFARRVAVKSPMCSLSLGRLNQPDASVGLAAVCPTPHDYNSKHCAISTCCCHLATPVSQKGFSDVGHAFLRWSGDW